VAEKGVIMGCAKKEGGTRTKAGATKKSVKRGEQKKDQAWVFDEE
jgi:hypothetical protein